MIFYALNNAIGVLPRWLRKTLLVMRITTLILLTTLLQLSAASFGQKVTIVKNNITLSEVFKEIRKQTGYNVLWQPTQVKGTDHLDLNIRNQNLRDALDQILKNKNLTYSIEEETVMIKLKEENSLLEKLSKLLVPPINIKGRIIDSLGRPLVGATIKVKGSKLSASTDKNGVFALNGVEEDRVLVISYLGYISKELKPRANMGNIILTIAALKLDEVTINTGMFDRNKETFTGLTRNFSGNELRLASRQNVLEALSLLDPSFKIIRDNNFGSDPNQLPKVELRGNRTLQPPTTTTYSQQLKMQYEVDPNQPLFILDGFETDLATIVNLDINRIESITLLKDAASTALYGSRSANGVVVIQTLRPIPGKLTVSYNATATLTLPDISGYNMMDASELLKFQELASRGLNAPGPFATTPDNMVMPGLKQAFRQNAVSEGINTNWLKAPLQNALSLNHNLSFTGGDQYFTYVAGISRNSNVGVMKGSDNKTTSGNLSLQYRTGKINVFNQLTILGNEQNGGSYGSFSDYVNVPAYYVANTTDRYLEQHDAQYYIPSSGTTVSSSFRYQNPLYNATLPSKNSVSGLTITNNTMANLDLFSFLRLSGSFQYNKIISQSDYFVSPLNTKFDNVQSSMKGSYDYNKNGSEAYTGNLTLTYNKVFAKKHILNANLRSGFRQQTDERLNVSAVGFSVTAEPLLYLANSYMPDSKPGGSTFKKRSMELIASLNYSYDMKYNLDLAYNRSGTSNFGLDNPYQSFYSIGLGWNIGREDFIKNVKWIDHLYLTSNLGLTGNQNAGNFGSRSTYVLENTPNFFGESITLKGIGNPNLNWTKTYNLTYNLSGRFFNSILSTTLSGYQNITDPLIIAMPMPPSLGIAEGIPKNIGKLKTVGYEVTIDARLANTRNWTVNLGFNSPVYYKSEYSGLGDALHTFNDAARKGDYLQRYYDGASPDDVWAVRSLGIGQARGFETFLDKNGNYTYLFNTNNEVVVGSSRPVTQGNVNVRVRYKKLTVAVFTSYAIGDTKFNTALYSKVEKISASEMENNHDKRALYVRWQNPGDDASFLGIGNTSLGMSDRFLQKENYLNVSNITFNYDVLNQYSSGMQSYIRKKLGLRTFGIGLTTSNIFQFRFSNVKMERGLNYPFSRSAMLNLNLTF